MQFAGDTQPFLGDQRAAPAARSSSASRSRVAVSAASARRLRTTSPSATASARITIWDRKSADRWPVPAGLNSTTNRPVTMKPAAMATAQIR